MLSTQLNDKIQTLVHGELYIANVTIGVEIDRDSESSILISGSRKIIMQLSEQLRIKMNSRNSLYIAAEVTIIDEIIEIANEIKTELEQLPNINVEYVLRDYR
jgi:hypothetical protein